jgi:hypothetical protein
MTSCSTANSFGQRSLRWLSSGCWAHARRGFFEALDHAPKEAGWVLIRLAILRLFQKGKDTSTPRPPRAAEKPE